MFYPRFTKVIISHFMSQDQSIPSRNKVEWHIDNDDPILTTMRFIPQHEVVQKYGAILPDNLTTQAMKEFEAYKTYYAFATGKAIPKQKIKSAAKVTKSGKKKQPAQGLETLSDIALSQAEQMKIALERSKTQQHSSHASGSGVDEGTGVKPGVPNVPSYGYEDEEISWKSSDDEGDDDASKSKDDQDDADNDSERTKSDNDGDEFVHPKFTTHDEEDKEEESFDLRVHTPCHHESTDDEACDEVAQSGNAEEEKMDEEQKNEEAEVDTLYKDVNVNLEGRETKMTDAPRTIIQTSQVIEDTHVIITLVNPEGQQQSSSASFGFVSNMLHPSPDTGIDSIFNLNSKSTSLVDVPVTAIAEPPLLFATTLPLPPTPLITHLQQTLTPTLGTVLSSSLQDLPNFGSLFGFDIRLKTLEVQLKTDKLREDAQTENQDFINNLDAHMQKIIKEQNLYKALVEAYEADKDILETYGDTVTFKRRQDDHDEDEEPSAGSNRGTTKTTGKSADGSKSHHKSAGQSAQAEEPMHIFEDLEEPTHQEFETQVTKYQPVDEARSASDWFQKSTRLPSPDRDWNKTLPTDHGPVQPWLSNLAQDKGWSSLCIVTLMDTTLDFFCI
ncbi:hypothetical protein Tco_0803891 [Tanacetum coccineum]|uniref:Uncharacterized protein n=1 Tax=Tanacetum coccineum TaxID=301880 RepID=A0ABQ5A773_9ASTR